LDEIEKAHPDTFNVLLQVLDDGRLTDNKGRVANFKNALIIMTSNMGAETILENFEDLQAVGPEHQKDIIDTTKIEVFEMLKSNLRPEFLNRIDEKIMFLPLTKDEIKQIAKLLLRKVEGNLADQELRFEITDKALDLLADLGYDPQFGARPLKRVIQKEIVNELARRVLSGDLVAGEKITIDANAKGFLFGEDEVDLKKKPSKKKSDKIDDLLKATKDVEDATKDLKADETDN
jgi:ATP-dependent Clp protease ATP-binding subunit ClpB